MIRDALLSREGSMYLGAAALVLLIDVLLVVSTYRAYERQWDLRDAARAYAQGTGDAADALLRAREQSAADPSPSVLLGGYELERATDAARLESAKLLFEEARELAPGRTSAVLGLIATRLRLAELRGLDELAKEAAAVERLLADVDDTEHPDVQGMKAALLLVQGKAEDALLLLEEDLRRAPGLAGSAARAWNLGIARILARRGAAFEGAAMSQVLRRRPLPRAARASAGEDEGEDELDPETQVLVTAYRMGLADPGTQPADEASLTARCELAAKLIGARYHRPASTERQGRFLPRQAELPGVLNALGLGWFRLGRFVEARAAFAEASRTAREREPLYLLNQGQAAYQAGLAAAQGSPERKKLLKDASDSFERVCALLDKQKGREVMLTLAATNAAAILLQNEDPRGAAAVLGRHEEAHPSRVTWLRDMGALEDHQGRRQCAPYYREAIELGHPDAPLLRERLLRYEGGR